MRSSINNLTMKNIYILLFLIPTIVFGQSWEKTFINGGGFSVHQNNDGGYTITGYTLIDDNYDVYLIKTDENGDTLWTKTYGGIYNDIGYSGQQTTDGGYIITGCYGASIHYHDVYLIKTDEDGDTLWTKTYGGIYNDIGFSVQQTTDGGYIITGIHSSNGIDNDDVYLIKTDGNGDTLWTKTYSGDFHYTDCGKSVQQSSDGGYIITGYTFIPGWYSYYYLYLLKTDENGDILWTKNYKKSGNARGYSVKQTFDGGYIVTGYANSDVYLIRTKENGDTLWTKTFGGELTDMGYSVLQTTDGGYIITGMKDKDYYENTSRVFVIKTDDNGDTSWTKSFGVNDNNIGYQIKQTTDGGFIITGLSNDGSNNFIYLIKTDSQGNIVSTTEIPFLNPNRKLVKIVDFSGKEIIKPHKNIPFIEIYDDGTTQKKMINE